jgi:hypothetical protein
MDASKGVPFQKIIIGERQECAVSAMADVGRNDLHITSQLEPRSDVKVSNISS